MWKMKIRLADGVILSASLSNVIETLERDCTDAAVTKCGNARRHRIERQISVELEYNNRQVTLPPAPRQSAQPACAAFGPLGFLAISEIGWSDARVSMLKVVLTFVAMLGVVPFLEAQSIRAQNTTATPIQEGRFVTLGGIEQWITIRGANRANPVLMIVHGGPGDAQSSLHSAYAVYEKDFTIVQWDQRGAGQTYAKNPNSPPEPERVELDGIELAQYLCDYLAKKKILLLGHSWGSYLGVGIVQRRPELIAAYVGTGQVGSWRSNVQAQFDFLLAKARSANDSKQVQQLEAIGKPDPTSATQYFSWWTMRNPYMSPDDARWFQELEQIVRSNPEFTEGYIKTLGDGMRYSGRSTLSTMLATELPTTASTLKVPFFVIQGREDMVTPTSVAVKYFNVVKAPKKKLILIEHAGHFALVTHREEFLAALVKNVRPLAIKSE